MGTGGHVGPVSSVGRAPDLQAEGSSPALGALFLPQFTLDL